MGSAMQLPQWILDALQTAAYGKILETVALWAAVLAPVSALILYVIRQIQERRNRLRLEEYLRAEKRKGKDKGQRSLVHLTARVGLTKDELLRASDRSKKIRRRISADKSTCMASSILLEYAD